MRDAMIIGCGYTGARVAARLVARGVRVVAASREPLALGSLAARGAELVAFDAARPASFGALAAAAASLSPGFAVLLSVPPVARDGDRVDATAALLDVLGRRPGRAVYLSSASVYGAAREVDASTPPAPRTREAALRLEGERAVAAPPRSWLVLRPAAIYGPERGLHARGGDAPRRKGDPDRLVSRIHVDDLAALCEAALGVKLSGAFPAADRTPATPREVAAFCASQGLAPPALREVDARARSPGRRVDGRDVFDALGVAIAYPSFREGIIASVR